MLIVSKLNAELLLRPPLPQVTAPGSAGPGPELVQVQPQHGRPIERWLEGEIAGQSSWIGGSTLLEVTVQTDLEQFPDRTDHGFHEGQLRQPGGILFWNISQSLSQAEINRQLQSLVVRILEDDRRVREAAQIRAINAMGFAEDDAAEALKMVAAGGAAAGFEGFGGFGGFGSGGFLPSPDPNDAITAAVALLHKSPLVVRANAFKSRAAGAAKTANTEFSAAFETVRRTVQTSLLPAPPGAGAAAVIVQISTHGASSPRELAEKLLVLFNGSMHSCLDRPDADAPHARGFVCAWWRTCERLSRCMCVRVRVCWVEEGRHREGNAESV